MLRDAFRELGPNSRDLTGKVRQVREVLPQCSDDLCCQALVHAEEDVGRAVELLLAHASKVETTMSDRSCEAGSGSLRLEGNPNFEIHNQCEPEVVTRNATSSAPSGLQALQAARISEDSSCLPADVESSQQSSFKGNASEHRRPETLHGAAGDSGHAPAELQYPHESEARAPTAAEKDLMKLRKKLREIERIEERLAASARVDPLQLPKLQKKQEVVAEVARAERAVAEEDRVRQLREQEEHAEQLRLRQEAAAAARLREEREAQAQIAQAQMAHAQMAQAQQQAQMAQAHMAQMAQVQMAHMAQARMAQAQLAQAHLAQFAQFAQQHGRMPGAQLPQHAHLVQHAHIAELQPQAGQHAPLVQPAQFAHAPLMTQVPMLDSRMEQQASFTNASALSASQARAQVDLPSAAQPNAAENKLPQQKAGGGDSTVQDMAADVCLEKSPTTNDVAASNGRGPSPHEDVFSEDKQSQCMQEQSCRAAEPPDIPNTSGNVEASATPEMSRASQSVDTATNEVELHTRPRGGHNRGGGRGGGRKGRGSDRGEKLEVTGCGREWRGGSGGHEWGSMYSGKNSAASNQDWGTSGNSCSSMTGGRRAGSGGYGRDDHDNTTYEHGERGRGRGRGSGGSERTTRGSQQQRPSPPTAMASGRLNW